MAKKPSRPKKMRVEEKIFSREFFQKTGAEGGKLGGKIAAEKMTAAERSARAKKAVDAREAKRKRNKKPQIQ